MKDLFKKSWFIGTLIIGLMLIVFLLNLWIMSLKLTSPYGDENFWTLAANVSQGDYVHIFAFIFMLVFYISIAPLLLSGFSFFKKKNWGYIVAVIYFLGFDTTFIIFQAVGNYMSVFALILTIINIVFIAGIVVLLILRTMALHREAGYVQDEKDQALSQTNIPLSVLIIDIVSIAVFLTTFFIPFYSVVQSGSTYYAIAINVLLFGDTNLETVIFFLVNFSIFLGVFLYFAQCLSFYFFDKKRFIDSSKTLIQFAFITTLVFFLLGLFMDIYYTLGGSEAQTVAFIPLLLMVAVIFAYAIFRGKYSAYQQIPFQESKLKYARIEPLSYVVLMTAITGLLLLLAIVKFQVSFGAYTSTVRLTGINILKDYANIDPGYRLVAYALVVIFIASGLGLIITISSYLSKYRNFNSIVKGATAVNIFFVFLIAVSAYYFQIAKQINIAVFNDIFNYYGIHLPDGYDLEYKISTDAIYALIAAVALLIVMFLRKAFDRDELNATDANALLSGNGSDNSNGASPKIAEDDDYLQFDPCPAFTVLDAKNDEFRQELQKRKALKTNATTLNELINFVVEYAKNSRLHLSYTPEDIATFVAGLGASRLSILQGMSGTGKTSLPKIFSEAVFGNCEIIEVESSWKDKNELLGYYNEFSMKYTPKKFTLALYKAALNKEIFTFILLDEMNLSRIEYYFSDFLSLMENEEDHREIKLINIRLARKDDGEETEYLVLEQGNTLRVPPNVWFIGTANRDESTFVISDKVYDRAHTMNFVKRAPKVRNYSNPMSQQYYDYQTMKNLFETAKQNGDFDAESSDLIKQVEVLLAPYNISFGNRILNQIEDFVNIYKACFPNEDVESEAIEKILLSKVVAKLEVKTIDDKEKLEVEFEKLNLKQCADFIKRLDNE